MWRWDVTDEEARVYMTTLATAEESEIGPVPPEVREAARRADAALRVRGMLVEALENATLLCNCGRPDRCETDGRRPCSYVAVARALREAKKP